MRRIGMLVLTAILVASVTVAEDKTEITIKSMPPSVAKTVPQAGDTEVDPSLKEIQVTFSKDMMTDRMWAVCQISKETFPKTGRDIHYLDDKRTCVIPVELEPQKTYVLWFNRGKFNSFRDTDNNPAVPYLLVFHTGSGPWSSSRNAEEAAVSDAEAWLSLVDNRKYAESWDEAAQYFKSAVTKEQWQQTVRAVRGPLGKNISRELKSKSYQTSLPGAPDGEYVVIQYEASFEKKKSAIETVTPMLDKDGKWRVSGYYIR